MKPEFIAAEVSGDLLLKNAFSTARGYYEILIKRYDGNLYFFKYRNEELLECQNLNKMKPKG